MGEQTQPNEATEAQEAAMDYVVGRAEPGAGTPEQVTITEEMTEDEDCGEGGRAGSETGRR